MRCLVIPKIIDKSAVAPKYHKGYTVDIDLHDVPVCDYNSLLSAMSVVILNYDPTVPGHGVVTSYGVDLCRCGYRYVSGWLSPDEYIKIAKYYSLGKELINSVLGLASKY